MDKVTIMSRKKFLTWFPPVTKNNLVAIRIGDQAPIRDTASKRYADTLSLAFYDEWDYDDQIDRNTPAGSNRLTEKDKQIIDDFIDKYADKYFVVHCEQGISRSAAVGYYILKKLGYTAELNQKKASSLYQPNIEVYGILIDKPYTQETAAALTLEIKSPTTVTNQKNKVTCKNEKQN
ncbi:MAG: hypothetical protein LKJ22_06345 [Liquorilactobacillus nagelii]|jgi:predicted protein tyrosine phosphatase|uniref:hypothetical protein n=1 Tax=Liquorilactobacillus nagelii TaxID=82688 RepID=UPI00242EE876|nr:hypothetical protein [Liquorilactobacillus nagelii]MCI1921534.1 hypothetical protein [Liquorilactobacillus nagelii]MCI1976704.1 hypothetical protein [Liquorilactobacillus nagelii]